MNRYSYKGVIILNTECKCGLHKDVAKRVKAKMLSDDLLFDIAEVFKIFGDSTRMKIVYALKLSELCVYDLAALMIFCGKHFSVFYFTRECEKAKFKH